MSAAWFDIGERPTQPPEDIDPRAVWLEHQRVQRIRDQVCDDATCPGWWERELSHDRDCRQLLAAACAAHVRGDWEERRKLITEAIYRATEQEVERHG